VVLSQGRAILVLVGAVCAGACGNGLAPGTSGDRAMFIMGARLASGGGVPAGANLRAGVIWTDPLQRQPDVPMPSDWLSSTVARDTFDGFLITFYRPPPPAALFRIDAPYGGDSIEMAFGQAIIFDDVDNNGVFQIDGPHAQMAAPDSYLAATGPEAIVYVARPFSNAQDGFPLGPAILPGYTQLYFFCNGQVVREIRQNVGMQFVLQPSQNLPEIGTCMRTHSP
jgi:hypothetical protein